jgi:uncharacterized protein
MYDLIMRRRDGGARLLQYSSELNVLSDEGAAISPDIQPENEALPGEGKLSIRLVMGKKCNFSCAYCKQAANRQEFKEDALVGLPAAELVDGLIFYAESLGKKTTNVQFWGGETLLYFPRMKEIHAAFLKRMPAELPGFSYATNGSLLKGDRFHWTMENRIDVAFSWDGPGQHLRGWDTLSDPEILKNVRALLDDTDPGRLVFLPTISNAVKSHRAVIESLKKTLARDDFRLGEGQLIHVVSKESFDAAIPEADLPEFSRRTYLDLLGGAIPQFHMPYYNAMSFIGSLGKPVKRNHARCFVCSGNVRSVDQLGNIIVCQNFSAAAQHESGESYCLGNIFQPADERQPALTSMGARRASKCPSCVVYAVCRGGCPFGDSRYERYSCQADYYQYLPVFGLALHMLTGDILEEVRPATQEARPA